MQSSQILPFRKNICDLFRGIQSDNFMSNKQHVIQFLSNLAASCPNSAKAGDILSSCCPILRHLVQFLPKLEISCQVVIKV